MFAKFCVTRETDGNFMRLFVNRRAYSIQSSLPRPNGSYPYHRARDWQTREPKPLDEGAVRMHLNGDITISLYAIKPRPSVIWINVRRSIGNHPSATTVGVRATPTVSAQTRKGWGAVPGAGLGPAVSARAKARSTCRRRCTRSPDSGRRRRPGLVWDRSRACRHRSRTCRR